MKRRSNRSADAAGHVRLQKYLADAGIASRRNAEELILEGRVLVNGDIVDTLPVFVDPQHDEVVVDGAKITPGRTVYCVLHKPANVVVAAHDPAGRRSVFELLPDVFGRVFPVGKMDAEASGILFLTNDGELAARLGHPFATITTQYQVEVRGQATPELIARLRRGIFLAEGKAVIVEGEVRHTTRERSVLWIELRERINRQLRRMLAQAGFPVKKLIRLNYGPLKVKGLPTGASRELSHAEVELLMRLAGKRDETQAKLRHAPQRGKPRPTQFAPQTAPAGDYAPDADEELLLDGEDVAPPSAAKRPGRTRGNSGGGSRPARGKAKSAGGRPAPRGGDRERSDGPTPVNKPRRRVIS